MPRLRDAAEPAEEEGRLAESNNRAAELMLSYQRGSAGPEALDDAIALWRQALTAAAASVADRARVAANLANGLLVRYENTGQRPDLDEAVKLGRVASTAVVADATAVAVTRAVLSAGLTRLAQQTGDAELMREAVLHCRAALDVAVSGDSDQLPYHQANLAYVLSALFDLAGDTALLEEAVELGRLAVRDTDKDHPNRADFLAALGGAMSRLGQERGDDELMREALALYEVALRGVAGQHHRHQEWQADLASIHLRLFGSTGDSGSLMRAAESGRAAARASTSSRRNRSRYLANLNVILLQAAKRTGALQLLVEAGLTGSAALRAAPRTDPMRAVILSNLGVTWMAVHEHPRSPRGLHYLRVAVHDFRSALAATPDTHPYRARHLHNLSYALRELYWQNDRPKWLAEAVRYAQAAVDALPADHPDLAACQFQLGSVLRELASRTGRAELSDQAYRWESAAAANPAAPVITRIMACRQAASHAVSRGHFEAALDFYDTGIELAHRLAPRSLGRPDRQQLIEQLSGIAAEAAAAAVSADQPGRAVELLEQSRGLLVADALDAKISDLTRLAAVQPGLADDFKNLMSRFADLESRQAGTGQPLLTDFSLAPATPATELPPTPTGLAADRQATQQAWTELVEQIRAIDGFADFLGPPRIADLAVQAAGPIVFVYAAPARCDALIVRPAAEPVQVVSISHLTRDGVLATVDRLTKIVAAGPDLDPSARPPEETAVQEILAWTWDLIAAPVLDALGYRRTPADGEDWPRIWWCPIGSVAYLPLHAAGGAGRAVIDLAVSSYTPTLRGLAYARASRLAQADQAPGSGPRGAVVVAAPEIPGQPTLPAATRETKLVGTLLGGAEILAEPTKAAVISALPGYQIAHFACHAVTDPADPAASHLVLADHAAAPLTVAEIGALSLNASLAYLSACQTTVTTAGLADEAVHITGAFHLAGYHHVVGTAWSVDDPAAYRVARSFYASLTHDGTAPPDFESSAIALHHAVRHARDAWPQLPLRWAPYTHTGI